MIRNFSDHAANERTFLAWVRTAIAIMAFGFVIEKFNLFLKYAAVSVVGGGKTPPAGRFGGWAGLVLILMGLAIVGIATVRFLKTARNIDSPGQHLAAGSRFDVALSAMLGLLGIALVAYLGLNLAAGS
ncbi:MAG TPA: DUF202 domain-containing protein [Caulobacteraceae bacterium]|nr:DUF202 domain-containing protein [Caulobacteraceae bacterium]